MPGIRPGHIPFGFLGDGSGGMTEFMPCYKATARRFAISHVSEARTPPHGRRAVRGDPGIWGTQSVVRVKGEKSNRRSLGFARDDSFLDWMVCGVADPYIPSTFS